MSVPEASRKRSMQRRVYLPFFPYAAAASSIYGAFLKPLEEQCICFDPVSWCKAAVHSLYIQGLEAQYLYRHVHLSLPETIPNVARD